MPSVEEQVNSRLLAFATAHMGKGMLLAIVIHQGLHAEYRFAGDLYFEPIVISGESAIE